MKKVLLILCAALTVLISGCNKESSTTTVAAEQKTFKWKMVMAWPKNFPGLGTSAEVFADNVNAMSNGRLQIKVYGAGELVPAFEVFDAVSQGTAERSEEHTSELQSRPHLVCRLLLEKKK